MHESNRPVWLRSLLGFLLGAWAFIVLLVSSLAVMISLFDVLLPGDGIPALPGTAALLLCLAASGWATVWFVKRQDAFLARYPLRTQYVVLVVLLLFTVGFFPVPFTTFTLD
ncbi:MAG TPA: hypothetical protein PKC67_05740 [Kiritimatiellia bacterium]|nr:hypothetical protein [Kiritimatiellia bacterium]HMP33836.1 hypothetical protein [Kiritimatiellia bacterium]